MIRDRALEAAFKARSGQNYGEFRQAVTSATILGLDDAVTRRLAAWTWTMSVVFIAYISGPERGPACLRQWYP